MTTKTVFNGLQPGYSTADGKTVYENQQQLAAAVEAGAPTGPYIQIVNVQILTVEE